MPKLYLVGGVTIILLLLTAWGFYERSEKLSIKADYDGFIAKAQILAAERLSENQRKEVEYRERLKTAEFAAAVARNRLREYTERTDLSRMSFLPASTENRVCFDKPRLEQAIGVLVTDLQGIAEQGDIALIDLQTVLSGWPQ